MLVPPKSPNIGSSRPDTLGLFVTPPPLPWARARPLSMASSSAQMARRLRALSHLFVDAHIQQLAKPPPISIPRSTSMRHSLILESRAVAQNVVPEIAPIINLRIAQKVHRYILGMIDLWSIRDNRWFSCDAELVGTELILSNPMFEDVQYYDLADADVVITPPEEMDTGSVFDVTSGTSQAMRFRLNSQLAAVDWIAAINLAQFERTRLAQAYTASVLSVKARDFHDVHVLLQKRRHFAHSEWCSVRFPQLTQKWIKVYVSINPGDKKRQGLIAMYLLEKISKKTMLAYIDDVDNVFNVFPEQSSMIDLNAMLRLLATCRYTPALEQLAREVALVGSKQNLAPRKLRFKSLSQMQLPPPLQAALPIPLPLQSPPFLSSIFSRSHKRAASEPFPSSRQHRSDMQLLKARSEKLVDFCGSTSYCYILPQTHPGVAPVQTMIRTFMPIVDAFKLYGRPHQLISDKNDPQCILYGLPSLPHYQYMPTIDAAECVASNFLLAMVEQWDKRDWYRAFSSFLIKVRQRGGTRGYGDICDLYGTFDDDFVMPLPVIDFPGLPQELSSGLERMVHSDHRELFLMNSADRHS